MMMGRFVRPLALSLSMLASTLVGSELVRPLHAQPAGAGADTAPNALRFRLPAEPATLDWNLARTSHETYLIMNLMAGLTEEGPDLKPRPALAEKWEVSPDGRTYTFSLRPGVKWTDGKPLRAADFEDSWFRLIDPKTKSSYASFLYEIQGAEAFHSGKSTDRSAVGIKALSDSKFQVHLRRSVDYFLHLPTFWVTFPIRADLIAKHGARWTDPDKLVTLGPYKLVTREPGRIRLARNVDYLGADPVSPRAPGQVDIQIEPDQGKARREFAEGRLDLLLNANTDDLVALGGAGGAARPAGMRVERFPYLATWYLGFNVTNGSLKDAQTRRAIALSIDRAKIPAVLQGGQVTGTSLLPPEMAKAAGDTADPVSLRGSLFDARAALTKAGHGEGRLLPRLKLTMDNFDGAEPLAKFIAQSAKGIGVNVDPVIPAPREFQRLVHGRKTAMFVTHWGADVPDPIDFFRLFLSNSSTNYTGWSNRDYDAKVEEATGTADVEKRKGAYREAEEILLRKEVAILPLFYQRTTVLLGTRVGKLEITPLNYLFLRDVQMN